MKNPKVLNGDRTCFNCAHHPLCHGRNLMWDFVINRWNGRLSDGEDSLILFVALAANCTKFDYCPDPPLDPQDQNDMSPPFTVVIQVRSAQDADVVKRDLHALLDSGAWPATVTEVSE